MVFDIETFYPRISECQNIVGMPDHDMIIINHSIKSLLFHENELWVKKEGKKEFDVTMGSNDVAKISELVGLLMLSKSVHLFQCLSSKIICRADDENDINSEIKFYFGLTETPFKKRFGNHTRYFKHKTYSKSTELSKYIWALKETGINSIVKWYVEEIYSNTKINCCKLCLLEKLYIIDFIDGNRLLNKTMNL